MVVWFAASSLSHGAGSGKLEEYRAIYDRSLKEINNTHLSQIVDAPVAYGKSLDALIESARKRGQLEELLALREEKVRFEDSRNVPESPGANLPESARRLHAAYSKALAAAEAKRASRVAVLTRSYLARLEVLKRELTAGNDIPSALEVKEEIERLSVIPELEAVPPPVPAAPVPARVPEPTGWPGTYADIVFFAKRSGRLFNGMNSSGRPGMPYQLKAQGNSTCALDGFECNGGRIFVEGVGQDLLEACQRSNALTLSASIQPGSAANRGPARILSFSTDGMTRNFTLGQEGPALVLRLRTTATGANGTNPQVTLGRLTADDAWTHVAITYEPGNLVCYMDGVRQDVQQISGDFSNWTRQQFVIGNEYRDDRPWHGAIRNVAIYSRALSESEIANLAKLSARTLGTRLR